MRDSRFIAIHRGGTLTTEEHRQLMAWACSCVERATRTKEATTEACVFQALDVARQWIAGLVTVADARQAALRCIARARELDDRHSIAMVRAAGHAVATAHMADHAIKAADYVLKAVACHAHCPQEERSWQEQQLQENLRPLIEAGRIKSR